MTVAAYQAPLGACRDLQAISLIREQIERCESLGVEILCCPEGVLGGLADYVDQPHDIAINVNGGGPTRVVAPLASDRVATIIGFTELDRKGQLYNAAAVFAHGTVSGLYRKLHLAINRSVYRAGRETPVFTIRGLTFGILICLDSTFAEPARVLVSRGARALFIPTNNGMPPSKGGAELVAESRELDIARAIESRVPVIRADVAGVTPSLASHGASRIVDHVGTVLASARHLAADLIVADIAFASRDHQAA